MTHDRSSSCSARWWSLIPGLAAVPLALLALALGGCGEGEGASAEADASELRTLVTEASDEVRRIETTIRPEWMNRIPFKKRLFGRKTALEAWLTSAEPYLVEGSPPPVPGSVLEQGRKLRGAIDEHWIAAAKALENLDRIAGPVFLTQKAIDRALKSTGLSEDEEIPLRDVTYEKGFLPRYEQAFTDLSQGINTLVASGDDVKAKIGVSALKQLAQEGPELRQRLERMLRDYGEIRTRREMAEATLAVGLEAAKKIRVAIAAGGEGAPSQELLESVLAANRALGDAMPDIKARLEKLRAGLVAEKPETKVELERLRADIDALRKEVFAPLMPVAAKLGIDLEGKKKGS